MRRVEPYLPVIIFSVALAVRIVYVLGLRASPLFDTLVMDELYHDQWARELAGGNWVGTQVFFRAPLYPYLLGVLYRVFGPNYMLVRLTQGLVGSVSSVLVSAIGRRLFNLPVALGAGLAAAVYPMLIYFDGELLITSLIVFLDLLLLLSLQRGRESGRIGDFALSGLILGLSAIARPNILVLLPFVLLWIMLIALPETRRGKRFLLSLVTLGACCLVISPVTLRNYLVGRDFVPISSQAGINFYIGNNPDSDGVTAIAPGTRGTWWGGYDDASRIASQSEGRVLRASEVSSFWMRKGLEFLKERPRSFLALLSKKVWLFYNGRELSNNKDIYFFSRFSRLLSALVWRRIIYFPFGIVSALSILGMAMGWRDSKKLFLAYSFVISYTASVVVFFVTSRYRMPVIPILLLFSAFAVWKMWRLLLEGKWRFLCLWLAGLVVLLLLANSHLLGPKSSPDVQNYYTLGTVYGRKGDVEKAIDCYRTAIRLDSTFADPHNNLGNLYARMGDRDGARQQYEKAIALDPHFSKPYFNLANTYYADGEFETAAQLYEQAIQYDSLYTEAAYSAALAYRRLARIDDAVRVLEHVERVSPGNLRVEFLLDQLKDEPRETP
jgi:tetratricopeptide (TPR) repeat protein